MKLVINSKYETIPSVYVNAISTPALQNPFYASEGKRK